MGRTRKLSEDRVANIEKINVKKLARRKAKKGTVKAKNKIREAMVTVTD